MAVPFDYVAEAGRKEQDRRLFLALNPWLLKPTDARRPLWVRSLSPLYQTAGHMWPHAIDCVAPGCSVPISVNRARETGILRCGQHQAEYRSSLLESMTRLRRLAGRVERMELRMATLWPTPAQR